MWVNTLKHRIFRLIKSDSVLTANSLATPLFWEGYTFNLWPMSWIRLAACCRYESSRSGSTPQRRDGVFSSCSRVKSHLPEPRCTAAIIPPASVRTTRYITGTSPSTGPSAAATRSGRRRNCAAQRHTWLIEPIDGKWIYNDVLGVNAGKVIYCFVLWFIMS